MLKEFFFWKVFRFRMSKIFKYQNVAEKKMFSSPALSPFSSCSSLYMRVLFASSSIFFKPHSPFGTLNTVKFQYPKCEKK